MRFPVHSGLRLLVVAVIVCSPLLRPAAQAEAAVPDYPIPEGHFFTQTSPAGGGGFSVVDDGQAAIWSEFRRLGGVDAVGYPISRRFIWNGYVTQAMQRVVFQWRPETRQVAFVNVFDLLTDAGRDDWLRVVRSVPRPLPGDFDAGKTAEQAQRDRLALLDDNPAIRSAYLGVAGDPVALNGLPTSRVQDMGANFTLRAQRVVYQQWKVDVPWAARGEVTVALGGSIAAEAGLLPATTLGPEPRRADAPVDGANLLAPVSKLRPLLTEYIPPDLAETQGIATTRPGILLRLPVLQALRAMNTEARTAGIELTVVSAYRSYNEQAGLFRFYTEGMGEAEAARISAQPGHSEHQLGTAIDFTSPEVRYTLEQDFGATAESRWLRANAARFGFVMSYPEGKEPVTGFAYEPWHYRFVGVEAATSVASSGLTLREYLDRNATE
ncbi:MAG: D-alanyl-D-alanine carboxypeptidase family protein [Dehalococcoidia bacterium]|nr:D-alanyl-D-alanine carboxypeptidase family protein [Dehalococcoidia bacterium]